MKALNFIPLLLWVILFPLSCSIDDWLKRKDPTVEYSEKNYTAMAKVFGAGILFWFILGIACCK